MGKCGIWQSVLLVAAAAATTGAVMSSEDNDGRIDYIEFRAANLEETKAFYGGVFSWKFTDYGPEYTSFEDGRLTGGFHHGNATPGGGTLAVIYAVDLEAMQSKIEQAGGTIVKPIFSFPGGRRFHFQDPSGDELAVWSDKLDPLP